MKKNILYSTVIVSAVLFSTTISALFAGYNFGYIAAIDLDISTYYYKNSGTITAWNNVNINATTLTGSGSISGSCTKIYCENFDVSGSVTGTQECFIKAKKFESSGTIEGKKVTIICEDFICNGSILAEECVIYANNTFDYNLFTRNPNGKYTINIAKYGFDTHTYVSLFAAAMSQLVSNYFNIPDENIESEVKKIRSYARINKFDDTKILEEVKKKIEEKINAIKERLHEKCGPSFDLKFGMTCGGLGTLGAAIIYRKFSKSADPIESLDVPAVLISGGSLLLYYLSYQALKEWYDPQYKERYHKLSLILAEVEQSLITTQVPEEETIILQ